jgi:hypothetical protein
MISMCVMMCKQEERKKESACMMFKTEESTI